LFASGRYRSRMPMLDPIPDPVPFEEVAASVPGAQLTL
jgi:hypothetical protein